MRVVAVSDTHTFEPELQVPDGDVLIHAGDFTIEGSVSEVSHFCAWLHKQSHRHKIVVAGNHDWLFERSPRQAQAFIENVPGTHYLQDSAVEIEGITFYGSPWQPRFCDWAFNVERGKANQAILGSDFIVRSANYARATVGYS
jgi:predicted phosphohydrolase